MSNFPKEQMEFLQTVYDMRNAQRAYFSQQDKHRLQRAKALEQKVDNLLQPYVKAGAIAVKTTSNQSELFQ